MAIPLLGALGRAGASALPNTVKHGGNGKSDGGLPDIATNFIKDDKNKANLLGQNDKSGLIQGFTDLTKKLPEGLKDVLLDQLKDKIGLDDKAFNAFSTLFKGGKFSEIPADQLLAAGKFIVNQFAGLQL